MISAFVVGMLGLLACSVSAQAPANMSAMLLMPKILYVGDVNFFILELQNQHEDGSAKITIVDERNSTIQHYEKTFPIQKVNGPTFNLNVSDIVTQGEGNLYCTVILEGQFGSTVFKKNNTLRIKTNDPLLLIQTDKKIYKPGQKVFIRVMPLDFNLRPRNGGNLSLLVFDPLSNVVASWADVKFSDMVMQFDFKLIEEPVVGLWYINVRYAEDKLSSSSNKSSPVLQTSRFTVSEYTLPKFEVTIRPPPYLLLDATSATWKICANYTFGKPVIGDVKINTTLKHYYWENIRTVPENYVEARLVDGCYNLTLDTAALNLTNPSFEYRQIQVIANVFEDGTKLQMNATNQMSRTSVPLKLAFQPDFTDKYFRPYMNTYGSLKVSNPDDTPAAGEPIELCLTATSEHYEHHYQRTDVRLMCKNYTSDARGFIKFTLPPHKHSVVSFNVQATSIRFPTKHFGHSNSMVIQQPRSSTFYRSFYSPSQQYIQFEPLSGEKFACDKPVRLSAFYTFEENDTDLLFRYVVMGRARNIMSKEIVVAKPTPVTAQANESEILTESLPNTFSDMASANDRKIGRIDFEIDPASAQFPQLTVALFYLNGTEVVADSIRVQRKVCSPNKVDLSFSETVVQPGANIGMTLTASADSQCGYQIVDRSVRLLSGSDSNPFLRYRDDLPDREIAQWEHPQPDTYSYCLSSGGQSDYVDSESVFLPAGWTTILYNINLKTRPCRSTRGGNTDIAPEPRVEALVRARTSSGVRKKANLRSGLMPADSVSGRLAPEASRIGNDFTAAAAGATNSIVDVRNYFPELWLFQISAVDGTGKLFRNLTAPHQVTTWNADATCIHKTDGLGLAPSKEVKTFQAFFADVNLPYSVKRLEVLPIIISVYNYLPHCMPVSLTTDPIPGLEARTPLNSEACVCADTSPFQYELRVAVTNTTEIGDLNVTVTAVNSENLSVCSGKPGAESVPSRDKITKQLKVVPEGFMIEQINSVMLCPNSGVNNADLELDVPADAVHGSARSLFSVSGDIMGQSASNLEDLIVLPTGCGEQNMAKFLSNLAVLDYLRSTSQLDASTEARIHSNLNKGYQNQLTFRGRDGFYSVWGGHWALPSSFLTAMVYQGFRKAHDYIFIDDTGLTDTYKYLLGTQDNTSGCFTSLGGIYSSALRSSVSSENNRIHGSYTAYVLVALHGALTNATRIEQALLCVRAQKNMNQHALALSAYAAALYNDTELATKYLTDLKAFENTKLPNQKFYYPSDSWAPQSIETSAYAILAQLTLGDGNDALQQVQPIVRWLMKKRNRNGGFSSSQDTVIGLQAMAKFAQLTFKDQTAVNNTLIVSGQNFEHDYSISKSNALIWDTRVVKSVPNKLTVTSSGAGCVVATSQLRYNVPSVAGETGFTFSVTVTKASTTKNVVLELCATYDMAGGQPSSMAIIELTPFSGYKAVKSSLYAILSRGEIKRFDADGIPVVLYFDEFAELPRCVTVELEQAFTVDNLQPGTAVIYDYYDKSKQKSVEFKRGDLPSEQDNE